MILPNGWYPKNKEELDKTVKSFLSEFKQPDTNNALGAIVPHAGWYFSGKLACRCISTLKQTNPDTVFIFGGHLGPETPRIFTEEKFETPLGDIENDLELVDKIKFMCKEESATVADNTVEVNLPFIKYFFPQAKVCAFRSPMSNQASILGRTCAEKAQELGRKCVFIGSLDLTHYGPRYGFTPKGIGKNALEWVKKENDKKIVEKMLELKPEETVNHAVKNMSSCSPGAGSSVIAGVKAINENVKSTLIDYYTSADIMGDNSNFVGYAGIVYHD